MSYLSFSTAPVMPLPEDVSQPAVPVRLINSLSTFSISFPHGFPHLLCLRFALLSRGIDQDIRFSTGSITNTKNIDRDFLL